MNPAVDKWLEDHRSELVESVRANLKFRSIEAEALPNKPFGEAVDQALQHALGEAKRMGFKTENMDGYCGWCEMGEGKEMLGVVAHLDVVPEGTGWLYPPYAAEVVDGVIYGRGVIDDKGPAFASLYAMKAIAELNIPLSRRVRLIFGCNEETGMKCLIHYNANAEAPTLGFSPDASYPVVNSEKNIYHGTFARKFTSRVTMTAGERSNIVPGLAVATVPCSPEAVMAAAAAVTNGVTITAKAIPNGTEITATGLGGHASTPEVGKNAVLALFAVLAALPLEGEDAVVAKRLHEKLAFDYHGEHAGIDCEDKSGRLTLNAGVIRWDAEGISNLTIDIRHPQSNDGAVMHDKLEASLGMETVRKSDSKGYCIPADSELVSKLLDVYAERAGKRLPPLAIGGGTYARRVKNTVGFGCEMPDGEMLAHIPNERMSVDELLFHAKMIADAILALAAK